MALANLSSVANISLPLPAIPYNPEDINIFKQNGELANKSDIYISITELPTVVNTTDYSREIPVKWKKTLNKVFSMSMGIVIFILMLGMGSHVYWKEVVGNLWPPLPILIGMCGQFVILPALAFGISIAFKMNPYVALGCLIVSCSPGGTFSNFFAYWVHGDVALSLVMTTCSTILSFGMMPLNLWIYSSNIVGSDSERLIIPYSNIVLTLGVVCGPVIIGLIIRHFSARIASMTTKISSIIGYIMVVFNTVCVFVLFWDMLATATLYIHASVVILPLTGMCIAYLLSYISGRSHKICRTIAIETASQNMPIAMGIIVLSFPELEVRNKMLLYPTLYAIYMSVEICLGALLFQWYYNHKQKSKPTLNTIE